MLGQPQPAAHGCVQQRGQRLLQDTGVYAEPQQMAVGTRAVQEVVAHRTVDTGGAGVAVDRTRALPGREATGLHQVDVIAAQLRALSGHRRSIPDITDGEPTQVEEGEAGGKASRWVDQPHRTRIQMLTAGCASLVQVGGFHRHRERCGDNRIHDALPPTYTDVPR
jgi:hypothetical protein